MVNWKIYFIDKKTRLYIIMECALLLLLCRFFTFPMIGKIFTNITNSSRFKNQVIEAQQWQPLSHKLETQLSLQEQNLSNAEQSILVRNMSAYLRLLQKSAKENNIQLQTVRPGDDKDNEFLIIQVQAKGPFHNLARFINSLERSHILAWVEAFEIKHEKKNYKAVIAVINFGFQKTGNNAEK